MAIKLNIEDHTGNSRQAKVNDTVPVKRLLDAVVTTLKLPSKDAEGQPITYRLRDKDRILSGQETLQSQNIRQDDTIFVVPTPVSDSIDASSQIKFGSFAKKAFVDPPVMQSLVATQPAKGVNLTRFVGITGDAAHIVNPILSVNGNLPARMPVDRTAPVTQLIPAITARLRLPLVDAEARTITYYLRHNGRLLQGYETLEDIGITDDDTLAVECQLPDVSSGEFLGGGTLSGGGALLGVSTFPERVDLSGRGTLPEVIAKGVSQYILISYHYADIAWASRIATQLREDASVPIIMFDCDDVYKDEKFSSKMRTAMVTAESAQQIIVVLSHKYLQSPLARTQLHVVAERDPSGEQGLLLPVHVEDCSGELVET